jgi:hypothetical protein
LPRVGPHPGTFILVALVSIGGIAAGLLGAMVMLGVFGPVYLLGAYERSREDSNEPRA